MEYKKGVTFSVILMTAVFLAACVQTSVEGPETVPATGTESGNDRLPIVIGGLAPLSGDAAEDYGLSAQNAAEIALSEVNAQGGINDLPLEILWRDGGCDPDVASGAADELINSDGVNVIIGGICSSETLGAAPRAEGSQTILISTGSVSSEISDAGDYIFRLYLNSGALMTVVARKARETGRTAAIIAENTDYAQDLASQFRKEFEDLGGSTAAEETFDTSATSVSAQVANIKSESPAVIFVGAQTSRTGILVLEEIQRQGINAQIVSDGTVLLNDNLVAQNPELVEGVIGTKQPFKPNEKAQALFEEYGQEKPAYPVIMSATYDAVYLVRDAFLACGTEDTACIRDFLYSVQSYDGAVTGGISIDDKGDLILSETPLYQATNGQLLRIE